MKRYAVRPARALGSKPSIFGTLIIGSDSLPLRIRIPTTSHPRISPSITAPISPSHTYTHTHPHTHTHTHTHTPTHTHSLSPHPCPSPLSLTLVICYPLVHPHVAMELIALQVCRLLAHKPSIPAPCAPFHTTR